MAFSQQENESPFPPNPSNDPHNYEDDDDDEEEEEDEVEEDDEEEDDGDMPQPNPLKPQSRDSYIREQRFKINHLAQRMSTEQVPIRVHDVVIKGNTKTRDWVIEAELQGIQNATTMQELLKASEIALAKLQRLGIFDSSTITLEAGPPELGDTANVIVQVSEATSRISGECGVYTKPSV